MKAKFLPLFLSCLLATSVYAHRDDYFGFTMSSNSTTDGWSVSGGTGQVVDGSYVVTATGGESVIWTRDLNEQPGTRAQTYLSQAILKYISGTGSASGVSHIVPKIILESYAGETLTFTFKTAPDDNAKLVADTAGISDGAAFAGDVRYIKVVFENVEANEQVSLRYIDLASRWFMPEVAVGKTIYIQAEDYNEYEINDRKGYSPILGGSNGYRPADTDMYLAYQDDGAFFRSWTYGNGHVDNWYGFAVKNMCKNGGTWNSFLGAYVDETSNEITTEAAIENWGAWLEYTIDVPQACVVDISLKAGSHWGAYSPVSGGTGKYGLARSSGGYTIAGMHEDWVKRYVASAVLSIDGTNLTTNWSAYPKNKGLSQSAYETLVKNPATGWTNTQISKDGNVINSDTLHIFPNPNSMNYWSTYYKSDLYTDLQSSTGDATLADYIKPDYVNVALSAGRHTLKVQSLAPMWHFDEIRIEAKEAITTKTNILKDSAKLTIYPSMVGDVLHIKGVNVDYSVVDLGTGSVLLTGFGNTVDVSNLSAGVYVIKVGQSLQRFIKK